MIIFSGLRLVLDEQKVLSQLMFILLEFSACGLRDTEAVCAFFKSDYMTVL